MSNIREIPYLKIVEQVQQTPEAIAVLHQETKLTYAQLHRLSNQLANYLRTQGVGPNTLVGIMTQRNPLMLVGILGILKAGGAYVPLDPSYPGERIRYILEHAKIGTLLTEYQVTNKLEECLDAALPLHTLLFLDDGDTFSPSKELNLLNKNTWSTFSDQDPPYTNDPDDLMTVLYTSGSTGRPKGVMLNHRGYMNRLRWMQNTFSLKPGDRVAQKNLFLFRYLRLGTFLDVDGGSDYLPSRKGNSDQSLEIRSVDQRYPNQCYAFRAFIVWRIYQCFRR